MKPLPWTAQAFVPPTAPPGAQPAPPDLARQREAQRQRLLLRALHSRATTLPVTLWMAQQGVRAEHGLRAYRDHALAQSARSLAVAYPTVAELVGDDTLATISRLLWLQSPPDTGDLADWGADLPAFIEASETLAAEPYLADVARLDWAVHRAGRAADAPSGPPDLQALLDADPAAYTLLFKPGTVLVDSAHPIVTLRAAHRQQDANRFDAARAALAAGHGESALVWRCGWPVCVAVLDDADRPFTQALLQRQSLAQALADAGDAFDFQAWLHRAVREGWLLRAEALSPGAEPTERPAP